jgi:hypothetical protein
MTIRDGKKTFANYPIFIQTYNNLHKELSLVPQWEIWEYVPFMSCGQKDLEGNVDRVGILLMSLD